MLAALPFRGALHGAVLLRRGSRAGAGAPWSAVHCRAVAQQFTSTRAGQRNGRKGLFGIPALAEVGAMEKVHKECSAVIDRELRWLEALPLSRAPSVEESRAVIYAIDRISTALCNVLDVSCLISSSHYSHEARRRVEPLVSEMSWKLVQLNLNPLSFDALAWALRNSHDLTSEQNYCAEMSLHELSSTKHTAEKRAELEDLFRRESESSDKYSQLLYQPLNSAHSRVPLSDGEMAQLPEALKESAQKWSSDVGGCPDNAAEELGSGDEVSGPPSHFLPAALATCIHVLHSVGDGSVRKRMFLHTSKCIVEHCAPTLREMCRTRREIARARGFESYAEMTLNPHSVIGSARAAEEFLMEFIHTVRPRAVEEIDLLRELKCAMEGDGEQHSVYPWDTMFLQSCFASSLPQLRFSVRACLEVLRDLVERLFDVSCIVERADEGEGIAPHVARVTLSERDGSLIGIGYLSFDDSNPIYCTSSVSVGAKGEHLAGLSDGIARNWMSCGFACDALSSSATISAREVSTLFHEWGHLCAGLLSSTELHCFGGNRGSHDHLEIPSALFECLLSEEEVAQKLLGCVTGGGFSDEVSAQIGDQTLLRSRDKGRDVQVFRAMESPFVGLGELKCGMLALLDLQLHGATEVDAVEAFSALQREFGVEDVSVFPRVGIDQLESLSSYGARYYSYPFTRVVAANMWEALKGDAPLLAGTAGKNLRSKFLRFGGAADPQRLLVDVLQGAPMTDMAAMQQVYL